MAAETKNKSKETITDLTHVKSTKGTHVYANPDEGMTNVYFPKTHPVFEGTEDAPKVIEMVLRLKK